MKGEPSFYRRAYNGGQGPKTFPTVRSKPY